MFNVRKDLSACCEHEGDFNGALEDFAQELNKTN